MSKFCTNCGDPRPQGARFCTACGGAFVEAPSPANIGVNVVQQALSADVTTRELATQQIITEVDIEAMTQCGHSSLIRGDFAGAEFWFMEVATAEADDEIRAAGIEDLSRLIYFPAGRLEEAEAYTRSVLQHPKPHVRARALRTLSDIELLRAEQDTTRFPYSEEWRKVDLTQPIRPGASQLEHYRRLLAYFFAKDQTGENAALLDGLKKDYMQFLTGFIIGLADATSRSGVDRETAVKALMDWLQHR